MELKGITCRIPLELHNRISGEIREMGSTMGQFIEMIIREHYEKGEKKMNGKRKDLSVSGKRGTVSKGKGVPGMV